MDPTYDNSAISVPINSMGPYTVDPSEGLFTISANMEQQLRGRTMEEFMDRALYSDLGIARVCDTCNKSEELCTCSDEEDAAFDMLLAQVATPNLAAMFSKAQEQGLVVPKAEYTAHA